MGVSSAGCAGHKQLKGRGRPLRGSRGHLHVLRAVRGSARCACWRAAGAAASLPRENPKLGSAGAGRARPTAVEWREGRHRGKRTEQGGCSRLLVRRLESREAKKAKEDSRASVALRRVEEQLARRVRGAGWRSSSPPSVPLLSDSFFVVGALWSLPTLLGASAAERTEQLRRRCLSSGAASAR